MGGGEILNGERMEVGLIDYIVMIAGVLSAIGITYLYLTGDKQSRQHGIPSTHEKDKLEPLFVDGVYRPRVKR